MSIPSLPAVEATVQDALIRDGVWSIVNGSEIAPTDLASDRYMYAKFSARKDRALATIVLSINLSLLYLQWNLHIKDTLGPAGILSFI